MIYVRDASMHVVDFCSPRQFFLFFCGACHVGVQGNVAGGAQRGSRRECGLKGSSPVPHLVLLRELLRGSLGSRSLLALGFLLGLHGIFAGVGVDGAASLLDRNGSGGSGTEKRLSFRARVDVHDSTMERGRRGKENVHV